MVNTSKKILLIGCAVVINEVQALVNGSSLTCKTIDAGLHLNPEQLKSCLQQAIDENDGAFETIVLGFGLCSNAVLGLRSRTSHLAIPRVDDCIAMLLGSQAQYKKEMAKAPGTYFLSKGWIDAGISIMDDIRQTAERYGLERAYKIQQKMFGHYTRLVYIASENEDQEACRQVSREAAAALELEYQELKGNRRILQAMIDGRWDDGFIVVEPGKEITLADFKAFKPMPEERNLSQ